MLFCCERRPLLGGLQEMKKLPVQLHGGRIFQAETK